MASPASRRSRLLRAGRVVLGLAIVVPVLSFFLFLSDSRGAAGRGRYRTGGRAFERSDDAFVTADDDMVRQRFAAAKAPGAVRIFVVGGSQAMGSPFVHQGLGRFSRLLPNEGGLATWLEAYLESLDPARDVEVVNAATGGRGFARHVEIVREVVAEGQPDIVLLLSGRPDVEDVMRPVQGDLEAAVRAHAADFERRVAEAAAAAEAAGVHLYVLTAPANLRDWAPAPAGGFDAGPVEERMRRRDFAGALALLQPETASAQRLFLAARCRETLGEAAAAAALYRRANDADPLLLRAKSAWNDALRGARGRTVHVLDLERELAAYARGGVPGADLFHDSNHFRLPVNKLVARLAAERMQRDGLFPAGTPRLDPGRVASGHPLVLRGYLALERFKWWRFRFYGALDRLPLFADDRAVFAGGQEARRTADLLRQRLELEDEWDLPPPPPGGER